MALLCFRTLTIPVDKIDVVSEVSLYFLEVNCTFLQKKKRFIKNKIGSIGVCNAKVGKKKRIVRTEASLISFHRAFSCLQQLFVSVEGQEVAQALQRHHCHEAHQ